MNRTFIRNLVLVLLLIFISHGTLSAQKKIFFVHNRDSRIMGANIDGSNMRDLIVARLENALDIVVDKEEDMIYWSETGKVLSLDLTNNLVRIIKKYESDGAFTTNINAIALDKINDKLYWINGGDGKIERSETDGSDYETVLSSNQQVKNVLSMELDPANELIFWSGIEYIRRTDFSGSSVIEIASDVTSQPDGLYFDSKNDKLYWADEVRNSISSSAPDGSSYEEIIGSGLENPIDLALNTDREKMYILDGGGFNEGLLLEADLEGSNLSTILDDLEDPVALSLAEQEDMLYLIDDAEVQQIVRSATDGSSRDTLLSELSVFQKLNIIGPEKKLFWISSGVLYRANFDGTGIEALTKDVYVDDYLVDPENKYIYWSENQAIRRMKTDGSNKEDVVTENLDDPDHLALDSESGKIYWVDGGFGANLIKYASIDGSENKDFISSLNEPVDLKVNKRTGKLYWMEGGFFPTELKRAELDGTGIESVTTEGSGIGSYYISKKEDLLFWSTRDIITAKSNGEQAMAIYEDDYNLQGLAVDPGDEKVYWYGGNMDTHEIWRSAYDGTELEMIITDLPSYSERELILYGDGITSTKELKPENDDLLSRIYPNPFNEKIYIEVFTPVNKKLTIKLFNLTGKLVSTKISKGPAQGKQGFEISAEGMRDGIYFLHIQVDGETKTEKLMLIRE